MSEEFEDLYAPIEENFIKANRSIRQALFNFFMYDRVWDEENSAYWLKVYEERIKFFCEKFNVSDDILASYF